MQTYAVCTCCGYVHQYYKVCEDDEVETDGALGCSKCGNFDLRKLREEDSIPMLRAGVADPIAAAELPYFEF